MVNETSIPAGYKQTEVGVIPEKWETKKLGEIAEINSDTLRNNTNANYTFTYVSLEDVQQGLLKNYTECVFDSAPSRARRRVQKSDVLLGTVRPNLKSHLFIKNDVKDFICSTGFAVIRSNKNEVKAEYIYYHLFGNIIERQINTLLIGSNYPAINCKEIKSLTIPLPPIAEQQAIAEVLGDVDALITALDRLIVKKRNIKQGAMQQLLTGQKRLPGFTGKWETKKLGEIAEIFNGGTPNTSIKEYWNGNIKWCTPTDITSCKNKYISDTEKSISKKGLESSSAKLLPIGSLLLCSRATIGEIRISNVEICTNQGFKSLICQNDVNNNFLYYYLIQIKKKLIEKASGSTFLEISRKDIALIDISIPEIPEQEAIAQVLSDMDAELEALEKKREKYKAIKNGMMHQLLTGKTRLL